MLLQMAKFSSFFEAEQYSIVHIQHIFFIHLSIVEHLDWFHNLTIVNTAAISMGVQVSL